MPTIHHHDDKTLVRRMLAGRESAFDEFFAAYFPGLYRFALGRLSDDPQAAEDIAQRTLCRAIRKLSTYRGEAALFTWLCTFCRHELSAHFQKESRRPATLGLIDDVPEVRAVLESLASATEGPDADLRRREVGRWVELTLDHLPRRYAQALRWKYFDELSVREIGDRLGLGAKAAESLLTRARRAFREGFETRFDLHHSDWIRDRDWVRHPG